MIITRCRYQMFNKSLLLAHWGISSRLCLQTCSLCAFLTDCRQETVVIGMSAAGEDLPEGSLLISLVHSPEEGGGAVCVKKQVKKCEVSAYRCICQSRCSAERTERWQMRQTETLKVTCCLLLSAIWCCCCCNSRFLSYLQLPLPKLAFWKSLTDARPALKILVTRHFQTATSAALNPVASRY